VDLPTIHIHRITDEEPINEFVEVLMQEQAQDHTGLLRYLLIQESDFRALPHYFGKVYVIRSDVLKIGYLWAHPFQKIVRIYFFHQDPSHRSKGFGITGLSLLEKEYEELKIIQVILHQSKKRTIGFFERCGYNQPDCDEGTGFCRMAKDLGW